MLVHLFLYVLCVFELELKLIQNCFQNWFWKIQFAEKEKKYLPPSFLSFGLLLSLSRLKSPTGLLLLHSKAQRRGQARQLVRSLPLSVG